MASSHCFKTHSYGSNMGSMCSEEEIVKMVVEMLLGLSNDLFSHFDEPLDKLFSSRKTRRNGAIEIKTFHVTHYGLNLNMKSLSSSLIKSVLNWFAQFGSDIFVCRKFAYTFLCGKEQHHLTSAVLDTFQSTLTGLLTTVEESLCSFESQVLGIQKDRRYNLHYKPKLTLIGLYQQSLRIAPLFRSLAGVVGSVVTALAVFNQPGILAGSVENALPTILEKLLVRGIMQDISEVITLGKLIDIQPLQRSADEGSSVATRCMNAAQAVELTGSRTFTESEKQRLPVKDLFGRKVEDPYLDQAAHIGVPAGSPERTPEMQQFSTSSLPSRTANSTIGAMDLSLKLHLPHHTQNELYLFSKLLLTSMAEQFLKNLTTAVWHQQQPSEKGTQYTTQQQVPNHLISSTTSLYTGTGPGGGAGTKAAHLAVSDSRAVHAAIEGLYAQQHRGQGSNSRSSVRQAHRHQLALLYRIGSLVSIDPSYEVPAFLGAITAEAMVSSADIQILQKSRIQRKNQSYNLSRLKLLVQESAEECRTAVIPNYHIVNRTTATATTGSSATATTPVDKSCGSGEQDPVMSYLRTGRSVKIVGVRTSKSEPAYRMHRPDKTDEALRAEQVATQEAKRESTIEERQRLTQSSLTLQSYQAGGLSSNANYLSSLSDGHKTSSVTTATTIAAVQNEGSPAPKKGKKGRAVGAAESPVSLSSLLCYTPSAVAIELALLSGLREQLQQARVDCASYVRTSHYLSHNLRFVRDVFFLGQPDLYAPIRELCLSLTDWSTYSEASLTSKRGYGNRASDVAFMGECIASAMLEKVPKGGVRHVSVQLRADSVSSQPCGSSRNKVELLREALAPLRSIPLSALSSSGNLTHAQAQGRGADRGVVDEVTLLTAVSSLHVDLLHQWPLTYFLDAAQLRGLNASLRFLMLITATRWAAEYWWMDVISNDSLNTAASACNPKSGARYAGYSSSRRLLSAQDLYLGDVLQAKRNARAGLGIWLHCVTSLNNIFMAHIHRTLWPEFEESLLSHEDSLLQMKADLRYVVEGASASLLLLREDILEVVVLGFAAAQALREAIIVEQAELSVVVDHNTKLHAAQWKKAAPLRKANREAEAKAAKRKDAPKPWRIAKSNNAQLARTSSAHSMKSDADSVFSGLDADEMLGAEKEEEGEEAMSLRTSAAVLIAYRAAEDAFAALKGAVEGLKAVVFGAVRSRLAVGKVDREGKALEELHMALS